MDSVWNTLPPLWNLPLSSLNQCDMGCEHPNQAPLSSAGKTSNR